MRLTSTPVSPTVTRYEVEAHLGPHSTVYLVDTDHCIVASWRNGPEPEHRYGVSISPDDDLTGELRGTETRLTLALFEGRGMGHCDTVGTDALIVARARTTPVTSDALAPDGLPAKARTGSDRSTHPGGNTGRAEEFRRGAPR